MHADTPTSSNLAAALGLALDADGRLDQDLPCPQCAYNLRGVSLAGACPECGVDLHSAIEWLTTHGGRWIDLLEAGRRWSITAVVAIPTMLIAGGGAYMSLWNTHGTRRILAAHVVMPMWWWLPAVMAMCGWWWLTSPTPDQMASAQLMWWRRISRASMVGALLVLATAADVVHRLWRYRTLSVPDLTLPRLALLLLGIAAVLCAIRYAWLLDRSLRFDPALISRYRHLWILPAIVLLFLWLLLLAV